jgi:hypothetical protein
MLLFALYGRRIMNDQGLESTVSPTRRFISFWNLTRTLDGSPNLYLHAGEVKGYGTVEWENSHWHPVEEGMASDYALKHPPRTRDLWLWGRPDETLLAVWDGDDWEEVDGEEENCEDSEPESMPALLDLDQHTTSGIRGAEVSDFPGFRINDHAPPSVKPGADELPGESFRTGDVHLHDFRSEEPGDRRVADRSRRRSKLRVLRACRHDKRARGESRHHETEVLTVSTRQLCG